MSTHTGFRAVWGDFTSSRGYRWPYPGNQAVAPLPDGKEYTHGDPCPQFEGDGLCIALDFQGAAASRIPAHTCLIVEWDSADELGRDAHKVRVSRCQVVEVLDVPKLARAGYLTRADLADVNLAGADLTRAYLAGADLARADLTDVNLAGADLTRADLARAYLADAYLADAYLARANLARANLARVVASGSTVWPDGFDPAARGVRTV
jgi:hypothetical protein